MSRVGARRAWCGTTGAASRNHMPLVDAAPVTAPALVIDRRKPPRRSPLGLVQPIELASLTVIDFYRPQRPERAP